MRRAYLLLLVALPLVVLSFSAVHSQIFFGSGIALHHGGAAAGGEEFVGLQDEPADESNLHAKDFTAVHPSNPATVAGTITYCEMFTDDGAGEARFDVLTDNGSDDYTDTDRTADDLTISAGAGLKTFDLVALGETMTIAAGQVVAAFSDGAQIECEGSQAEFRATASFDFTLTDDDLDSYIVPIPNCELQLRCINTF